MITKFKWWTGIICNWFGQKHGLIIIKNKKKTSGKIGFPYTGTDRVHKLMVKLQAKHFKEMVHETKIRK